MLYCSVSEDFVAGSGGGDGGGGGGSGSGGAVSWFYSCACSLKHGGGGAAAAAVSSKTNILQQIEKRKGEGMGKGVEPGGVISKCIYSVIQVIDATLMWPALQFWGNHGWPREWTGRQNTATKFRRRAELKMVPKKGGGGVL